MAEKAKKNEPRKGLTKPLINNVGGMIDQNAPSADQLLKGVPDETWSEAEVVEGRPGRPTRADDALVPTIEERRWSASGE